MLLEKAAMLDDVAAYDRVKAELAAGEDDLVPAEVVNAVLQGENAIRAWRQHRGLSQVQLAEAAGISQGYLAQMETGKRDGTIAVYRALADALGLDPGDLAGRGIVAKGPGHPDWDRLYGRLQIERRGSHGGGGGSRGWSGAELPRRA